MCGIFGYAGKRRNATNAVFDGLKRLDYRGYDSWGIAIVENSKILLTKHAGKVDKNLLNLPTSSIGIGHTRWATHGAVNDVNAHPHLSSDSNFVLAQNGIMENYNRTKKNLFKKYYKFISDTDTEVIVRLIENEQKKIPDFIDATRSAFNKLEGRNTVIILTRDGKMIGIRNGSPLVLGYSKNKEEVYLSSDTLSFSPYVDKTITLENNQMVVYSNKNISILDVRTGKNIKLNEEENRLNGRTSDKGNFKHFMLKEIYEQPESIKAVIKLDKTKLNNLARIIKQSRTVYCIGSGTAGGAALQIAFYLRKYSKINAIGLIGAECSEYIDLFNKNDLIIAPSQSGETADVLEVIEKAKSKRVKIASYVNMPGSLMSKMSDFPFMANAGPEICVMSTKVYISQLSFGYLLSKTVQGKYSDGVKNLKKIIIAMDAVLSSKTFTRQVKSLAKKLSHEKHIFLIAKGQNLQIIREGMIKIIEGSYIHAHAIPAGDLKHYAITLMEPGIPVVAIESNDNLKGDIKNAVSQIKARGAEIINLPKLPDLGEVSAILNALPLQLLAYYLALELGNNIDKPRNIAKSVTVK